MNRCKQALLILKPSPARETLSELLTVQGFDVVVQPSTFRAVSSLARSPSDVVIIGLDDLLEEEVEVVRVIREECPDAFLILTFTALNRRKARTALEMGADCYVLEPLRPEEIVSALRHLRPSGPVAKPRIGETPTEEPAAEEPERVEAPEAPAPDDEPLEPEEVDFINSSLAAEMPDVETAPEDGQATPEDGQEAPLPEEALPPTEQEPTSNEERDPEQVFRAPAHGNGFDADEQPRLDQPPPQPTTATVEREAMPERLASLRKLGASVAHEINNPLTTLSGWIQLLLKKANGNHDLRRTLVNMKEEADRIADVVRELSAISEPGLAGRGPLDVNAFAEAVIESFVNANGNQNIRVKRIFTSEPCCMKADRELLVRAVCDFLSSRHLDLGNSGSLVFTTTSTEDWVEFHVYEPGSQVDLEPLAQVLNSVNLGDGETIGQDLVLARCQEIISSHGGEFTAECDPREGLSFELRLPKAEA